VMVRKIMEMMTMMNMTMIITLVHLLGHLRTHSYNHFLYYDVVLSQLKQRVTALSLRP
jgi:hypothetical protein